MEHTMFTDDDLALLVAVVSLLWRTAHIDGCRVWLLVHWAVAWSTAVHHWTDLHQTSFLTNLLRRKHRFG